MATETSCMADDPSGTVNHLLQHCLEPPPGHCDFLRGIFSQCHYLLSNRPQQVEGDHPAKQADLGQEDVTVNDCITPTGMEVLLRDAPGYFAEDQAPEVVALLHSNTFLRSPSLINHPIHPSTRVLAQGEFFTKIFA